MPYALISGYSRAHLAPELQDAILLTKPCTQADVRDAIRTALPGRIEPRAGLAGASLPFGAIRRARFVSRPEVAMTLPWRVFIRTPMRARRQHYETLLP